MNIKDRIVFENRYLTLLTPLILLSLLVGCGEKTDRTLAEVSKTQGAKCALDFINGEKRTIVYSHKGQVEFSGWAVDSEHRTAPDVVKLVLTHSNGDTFIVDGATRHKRPDVAKVYKQDGFMNAGFRVNTDMSAFEKGLYGVSVQMPSNNSVVVCTTKRILSLD